jgi:hypothetical protein
VSIAPAFSENWILLQLGLAIRRIPWSILLQEEDERFDPHIAAAAGIAADDYGNRFALIPARRASASRSPITQRAFTGFKPEPLPPSTGED